MFFYTVSSQDLFTLEHVEVRVAPIVVFFFEYNEKILCYHVYLILTTVTPSAYAPPFLPLLAAYSPGLNTSESGLGTEWNL